MSKNNSTSKIAFQGVQGAYSHIACMAVCPEHEPLAKSRFSGMISAVQEKQADMAMVPVENSTAGRVSDIHHILPESGLHIIGEHFQPVEHRLLGIKGARLEDITEVHSHEQGLAQCRKTLATLNIKPVIHPDTAGAAKDVAARQDKSVGAIASSLAADIYGLDVLKQDINDEGANTTRFLLMAREAKWPHSTEIPAMTTMIFRVRSVPAVLYKALGGFATNGINLTKLESYMIGSNFEAAQFYIDCEPMKQALEELKFYCVEDGIQIMGCYPASPARNSAR
ncbi:MAG: prephenate dehydratase [Candidatus Puniceispirillaceae bacterium]